MEIKNDTQQKKGWLHKEPSFGFTILIINALVFVACAVGFGLLMSFDRIVH